ncbi:hypothetical protein U8326_16340 [Tsuneonella sp. CC-YZS046]|uniref:hypothetical protein n=1 Tax=Tsuneonella sp. CC-YZS046 TaxID=3042152 RepID=UPI002D765CC1|nr:hypothetical protein [Tsuneonella sp. CC-YZS046]WRO68257.1 hypothetical protein U8326_16340 [Tsuneonella sp. CC-YZS046]
MGSAQIAAAQSRTERDWEALHDRGDIQFAPLKPMEPPKPPEWLQKFQEWLADLLAPAGRLLGLSWPVFKWVLLAVAVILFLLLAWRLLAPLAGWRRKPRPDSPEWAPDRGEALALLEDADALAAAGHYDEATHLLLVRSVGQIRAIRPDLLDPSSTAREIAALPALPDRARNAFRIIAERVERSLFALVPLGMEDWQAARAAYADFAIRELEGRPA